VTAALTAVGIALALLLTLAYLRVTAHLRGGKLSERPVTTRDESGFTTPEWLLVFVVSLGLMFMVIQFAIAALANESLHDAATHAALYIAQEGHTVSGCAGNSTATSVARSATGELVVNNSISATVCPEPNNSIEVQLSAQVIGVVPLPGLNSITIHANSTLPVEQFRQLGTPRT
jgi:Flp pilus assembly protein TadG